MLTLGTVWQYPLPRFTSPPTVQSFPSTVDLTSTVVKIAMCLLLLVNCILEGTSLVLLEILVASNVTAVH